MVGVTFLKTGKAHALKPLPRLIMRLFPGLTAENKSGGDVILPKIFTVPQLGCKSPALIFKSVDLPQPVGPTTLTNSPSPIVRLTPFTAVYCVSFPLSLLTNVQAMSLSSMAGVVIFFFV